MWDGHTHSQFCGHGRNENTALMVEKAIALGFKHYSITEHAPLPEEIIPDPDRRAELSLRPDKIKDYFRHIERLKKHYGDKINILSGLEVDYLDGYEDHITDILDTYGNKIDDLLVSLHFLKREDGQFHLIDFSQESFKKELVDYYGSVERVHALYWRTIESAIQSEIFNHPLRRIGHLGLINKYILDFPLQSTEMDSILFFEQLFHLIKKRGWMLDFDVNGLNQPGFKKAYLTDSMLYWCRRLEIPIVYGSDAHGVDGVGQFYSVFKEAMTGGYRREFP